MQDSADTTTSDSPDSETPGLTRRRLLTTTAGAATAAVGIPAASSIVAAHFHGPEKTALNIDIAPDSDEHAIDPDGEGMIPVAVLQTDEFDPTSENVNYRFGAHDVVANGGGARPLHDGHVEDIDGDGQADLLLHFPIEDTGFDGDEHIGHLHWEKGERGAGHGLGGSDGVTFVDDDGSSNRTATGGNGKAKMGDGGDDAADGGNGKSKQDE